MAAGAAGEAGGRAVQRDFTAAGGRTGRRSVGRSVGRMGGRRLKHLRRGGGFKITIIRLASFWFQILLDSLKQSSSMIINDIKPEDLTFLTRVVFLMLIIVF